MKNLEKRKGFLNRHTDPLPITKCVIRVVINDSTGERTDLCEWEPTERSKRHTTSTGYLGTAIIIAGENKGLGYCVWQQNDSEFIWYNVVEGNKEVSNLRENVLKTFFLLFVPHIFVCVLTSQVTKDPMGNLKWQAIWFSVYTAISVCVFVFAPKIIRKWK